MSSTRFSVGFWVLFLLVLVRFKEGYTRPPSTPPPTVGAFRFLPWRRLFRNRSDECGGFRPRCILSLMLLLCGDVEPNPGPALGHGQYGCGYCECLCQSGQGAVACDNCSVWFHKSCVSMSSDSLVRIANEEWKCYRCQSRNNSSFLYHAYNLNVSNSFSPLAGLEGDDTDLLLNIRSPTSPFAPEQHSTPEAVPPARDASSSSESVNSSHSEQSRPPGRRQNFRTIVVNCNSVKGKRAEMAELCHSIQPDAMILTETRIDKDVGEQEFLPPNYRCVARKDRDLHGGGVAVAVKKDYVGDEVELDRDKVKGEVCWARIATVDGRAMYIGACYRPEGPAAELDGLAKSLEIIDDRNRHGRSTVVLGGDFNTGDINWDLLTPNPTCGKKGIAERLISIFGGSELVQIQRSPTRQGALLDLFATNRPGLVSEISNIPGISTAGDHEIIVVDSDVKPQVSKTPPRKVYKWHRADLDALRRDAARFRDSYMASADDRSVVENEAEISAELQRMMDAHVPYAMSKQRHDLPWLTPELKRECRRKQRLYKKWKRTGRAEDRARYEDLHTATRAALKRSHWGYINGILQTGLESGDTKPFWKYCKSQKQDNAGVSALKQGGQLYSDRKKKGDILADQFSSVFTDDASDAHRDSRPTGPGFQPVGLLTITVDGVLKLLMELNPKKASGPDKVPLERASG